jgi:Glycosyl-transferase for dystroglycan
MLETSRPEYVIRPALYKPVPHETCAQPEWVRERANALRSNCISIHATTAESAVVLVALQPPPFAGDIIVVSVALPGRVSSASFGRTLFHVTETSEAVLELRYSVHALVPDTDYVVLVALESFPHGPTGPRKTQLICRNSLSTPPQGENLLRNSGFEQLGDSPYLATQFHVNDGNVVRAWTPFYNGGLRLACGPTEIGSANVSTDDMNFVQPRSGICCAHFGYRSSSDLERQLSSSLPAPVPKFFGAHQAIPIPAGVSSVLVGAWVYVSPHTPPPGKDAESSVDALSMGVGWQGDDGSLIDTSFVPLDGEQGQVRTWRYVCVIVKAKQPRTFRIVHLYFHFHDRASGSLFVDDVSVSNLDSDSDQNARLSSCYILEGETAEKQPTEVDTSAYVDVLRKGRRDLSASIRPSDKQLTIAVPLTADRVLRLEAISRLYGGGPVAAAVLVRDKEELTMFVHMWKHKPWLRNHVDVTLVHMPRHDLRHELIPINALRNAAVHLAQTEFVLMLDVDMTPATESFACFRDPNGTMLSGLVPPDGSRIFTLPVFVVDVHLRPALNKKELLNQLNCRLATTYCMASQRAAKVDKWYKASSPYETRFTTDYEPYGICRRDRHPTYDERFVGYGFNKISWAFYAERGAGARLFVLSDSFVTHLNHADNAWVSGLSVPHYLRTWRRYFAFVAETEALHLPLDPAFIPSR